VSVVKFKVLDLLGVNNVVYHLIYFGRLRREKYFVK
jgi:hypothetical protein